MVELTVSMAIAGILVSVAIPSYSNATIKAKVAGTKMNARTVESIVIGYGMDHNGEVPVSRAQFVSSPSYTRLSNPFHHEQQGIGSWGGVLGGSTEDNLDPRAPVAIWNVDPESVAMPSMAGVVLYVPYRNQGEVAAGTNSLPPGGGDSLTGYTQYVIEGMSIANGGALALPIKDSRHTNFEPGVAAPVFSGSGGSGGGSSGGSGGSPNGPASSAPCGGGGGGGP